MTTEENKAWWHKQRELAAAGRNLRDFNLQLIEARYELESDEFYTARDKAIAIQKRGHQ